MLKYSQMLKFTIDKTYYDKKNKTKGIASHIVQILNLQYAGKCLKTKETFQILV